MKNLTSLIGKPVRVDYTDGADDENYEGPGVLVSFVPPENWELYGRPVESMCIVKTDPTDAGSAFPTRCVHPLRTK